MFANKRLTACAVAILVFIGCNKAQTKLGPPKPAEVLVTTPVTRSVIEYEEFTGRTEAVRAVDIRARVTGYLDRANFKDGADVKEGEILFEIDPRTYAADVDRAAANLNLAEAHFARLNTDYQRGQTLLARNALSEEEFDKLAGDRAEAEASVRVAKASLEVAKLNLGFTKVKSPLAGRISRTLIDPGNLVKADDTLLTSIVNRDPMYAYFDVDERTLLRLRRLVLEKKIQSAREAQLPVELGLTDEEGFSLSGTIDFVDNRLVANTGTLRVRGVFENTRGLLSPGLFVRVRMPIGKPRQALMVPEQALATDQGQKYVYVVDAQNVVQYRKVKTGVVQDGLRVIEHGVSPGERIVVSGLQRVRPGAAVDPKPAEAPSPGEP